MFKWPESKNPVIWLVRHFGKSALLILLIALYFYHQLGIKAKWPEIIFLSSFMISLGWLFLKQELKVYQFLGWTIIFSTLFWAVAELFPTLFDRFILFLVK
jgi:hypothetical protein